MTKRLNDHFVHDGRARARKAVLEKVRAEVEHEYAERLYNAGWLGRLLLYREMRRETKRRLDEKAPPWGLYSS